jgi:hypothetical protein
MNKELEKSKASIFDENAEQKKVNTAVVGDSDVDFKLVRSGSAPKLRDGKLLVHYELGESNKELSLRITANDKDGLFSREILPLKQVTSCLSKQPKGAMFSSSIFSSVFTKKSSNNAGFLAAILRAEKVLQPVEDKLYQHKLVIDPKDLEKHLSK